MQDIEKQLVLIEKRLTAIETKLGMVQAAEIPKPAAPDIATPPPSVDRQKTKRIETVSVSLRAKESSMLNEDQSAVQIMAWLAGLTFVLAAMYFLKLVYDTGWLTPVRQMALAYVAGGGLIGAGFWMTRRDHAYAAYLPAIGLVVLYLTTYVAHLYYELFSHATATACVGVTTLLGMWLGRVFKNTVYVIFSVVFVYATPLVIHSKTGSLMDLMLYYSAWSILFSANAIHEGKRIAYLLPMYLAMFGFDMVWRESGGFEWGLAASYQLIQFLIFSITTIIFSIKNQESIREESAIAHGVALLFFYGIEYSLLNEHLPEYVNYIAILSAVFVYGLYEITTRMLSGRVTLEYGSALVSAYCSWVALHAVFLGVVPTHWFPWAVLVLPVIYVWLQLQMKHYRLAMLPVTFATVALFGFAYILLFVNVLSGQNINIPHPTLALFVYVLMLYALYFRFSRGETRSEYAFIVLYAGHMALISCLIDVVEKDILLSALWAVYAVGLLLLALRINDKEIGKSALLIFGVAGLKVLLFDLSDINSLIRVFVLLVLSVSLYAGGYMYQTLLRQKN